MELQLGLALPTHNNNMKGLGFGFDLNQNGGFEPNEIMEAAKVDGLSKNKRSFIDAFKDGNGNGKLSDLLLCWNGRQPNEEDDDGKSEKTRTSIVCINNEEEEENQVVGWPPIKSWRKKLLHQHQHQYHQVHHHQGGSRVVKDQTVERPGRRPSNSSYVKVRMEGVPIGRKIDLRLYQSYQSLTDALIIMFAKYHKCDQNNARYTVTYQDKDGDWLLAGDVPWHAFIESVRRLEILRNAG